MLRVLVLKELSCRVLRDGLLRVRKCECGGAGQRGNDVAIAGIEALVARETEMEMRSLESLATLGVVNLCLIVP